MTSQVRRTKMLSREIIAVSCDNYLKHMKIICELNAAFYYVKTSNTSIKPVRFKGLSPPTIVEMLKTNNAVNIQLSYKFICSYI
jgi:hypothetical protein